MTRTDTPTDRYPTYPDTRPSGIAWLGDIPAHWETNRLKFLCEVDPRKSEVNHLPDDTEVTFLPMENIGEDGQINTEETRLLEDVYSGYTYFREGDILVAKITPCFENGKGGIAYGLLGDVGFGTTELYVLRCRAVAIPEYIHYLTRTTPFRKLGEAMMQGAAGQQRVRSDFVENFAIGIPPPDEQRTIAAFLDRETAKIDALIAAKQRFIALLGEKRSAVISHAVTKGLDPDAPMKDSGVEWLGEVPAAWEVMRLKHCVKTDTSISYGIVQPGEHQEDGVPFVQTTNISQGDFSLENLQRTTPEIAAMYPRSNLNHGDVILGIRASIGAAYVVPIYLEGANLSRGIARIVLKNGILAKYFVLYLQTKQVDQYWELTQQGSTFNEVSIANVRELSVTIPSAAEQDRIVEFVTRNIEKLNSLIAKTRETIALLQEQRAALISAAVTGKIDVRGVV
jgi:type I restriction enzyme, S subunit